MFAAIRPSWRTFSAQSKRIRAHLATEKKDGAAWRWWKRFMRRREAERRSKLAKAEALLFKRWLSILMLSIVLLFCAARVPAADSPRQRFTLDFGWKFTLGDPAL